MDDFYHQKQLKRRPRLTNYYPAVRTTIPSLHDSHSLDALYLGGMSTTKDGLSRLLEKQQEELENIDRKIELWTKYKDDYKQLKKLISNMQDKVRHPFDIPVAGSKLALVKGHIIHTNEISVLLGDNYFALRSSKQASDIIGRRLTNIDDMLKQSKEEKRKTEDWLKAASEHKRDKEEFVEIIETM